MDTCAKDRYKLSRFDLKDDIFMVFLTLFWNKYIFNWLHVTEFPKLALPNHPKVLIIMTEENV